MNQDYYVYLYFRPDHTPVYVGKGRGQRYREHFWRCTNIYLKNIIEKAKREGQKIPVVLLHENLLEEEAHEWESFWIKSIGRKDLGLGPLVNFTDGGEGLSGHKRSEEFRRRITETNTGQKRPNSGAKCKAAWEALSVEEQVVRRVNISVATKKAMAYRVGTKYSAEVRANMSAGRIRANKERGGLRGRALTGSKAFLDALVIDDTDI